MKKSIFLLLCVAATLSARTQAEFTCTDEDLLSIKGVWKKGTDAIQQTANTTAIKTRMEKVAGMFKKAYPNPRGIEPTWYTSTPASAVIPNGPTPYSLFSLYKKYFCNNNYKKIMLGDETSTWAYVFINHFSWFISNQYDKLDFEVNGSPVYKLPRQLGEWKGYTVYQPSAHNSAKCIVLTRENQLPCKNVTQEQYLYALKNNWIKERDKSLAAYGKMVNGYYQSIQTTRNNKFIKEEDKAKIIAGIEKTLREQQAKRVTDSLKMSGYWNDKLFVIDNYLRTNAQDLQQPAILDPKDMNDFKGKFSGEQGKGQQIVVVNAAYFSSKVPKLNVQMIILYWRWEENKASSLDFRQQFESNFPIEELKAMLDK